MTTEVWFRNPDNYIRECVEVLASQFAWDRGYLAKRSIDPSKLVELYYPAPIDYRMLVIGDQGSAELRRGHTMANPYAVYPTWEYGEDPVDFLAEMLAVNVGESEEACSIDVPPDERPVYGQEHRVVVTRPPNASTGVGRKFYRLLAEMQDEFPDTIVHLHGIYSWRVMFGLGIRSVDVDPRSLAKLGAVALPSGKQVKYEMAKAAPQWVTVVGFSPPDLAVPRNRCMFNMRSAWWAAEHYRENIKFRVGGKHEVDPDASKVKPATVNAVRTTRARTTVGDKFLCDTCSVQNSCKYFRSGEVCSIPESEPAGLARFFKTRDANTIIEGLGTLMAAQTHRLERGMQEETEYGELNPEVSRIINTLFANGVKLAKLVSPELAAAGAPKFGVQVNVAGTPNALTAKVVAELEGRGIPREKITPEMVMAVLDPPTIEAPVVDRDAG